MAELGSQETSVSETNDGAVVVQHAAGPSRPLPVLNPQEEDKTVHPVLDFPVYISEASIEQTILRLSGSAVDEREYQKFAVSLSVSRVLPC